MYYRVPVCGLTHAPHPVHCVVDTLPPGSVALPGGSRRGLVITIMGYVMGLPVPTVCLGLWQVGLVRLGDVILTCLLSYN